MRTALSKIEFRSGEGRGCNLSGSGRYPGNEAVTGYSKSRKTTAQDAGDPALMYDCSELRWHHASSYDEIRTPVLTKGRELFIAFASVLRNC